jgi:hypothetical protein
MMSVAPAALLFLVQIAGTQKLCYNSLQEQTGHNRDEQ